MASCTPAWAECCGRFRKMKSKIGSIALGAIVAVFIRYLFHVLSGAIFYGAWAEWFFTETVFADFAISKTIMETFSGTGLGIVYSAVYNACYMVPEIILTTIGCIAIVNIPYFKRENY